MLFAVLHEGLPGGFTLDPGFIRPLLGCSKQITLPPRLADKLDANMQLSRQANLPALSARAAARPLGLWTGFIDVQRSAVKVFAVQSVDCLLAFTVVAHVDKCKTPALSRIAISDDVYPVNPSVSFEQCTDGLFCGSETEVSYKNALHASSYTDLKRRLT